jgi:hypothetical protein
MPYYPEPPQADSLFPGGRPEGPNKQWRRAVMAHRDWVGNELWTGQARDRLDLSSMDAVKQFLATRGIGPEKGGGLHTYRLFTGDLPTEGFGMGSRGIPFAMEQYMPDWKQGLDRAIQGGMPRGEANQKFWPWASQTPDLSGGQTFNPVPQAQPTTQPQASATTLGTLGSDDDWRKRLGL